MPTQQVLQLLGTLVARVKSLVDNHELETAIQEACNLLSFVSQQPLNSSPDEWEVYAGHLVYAGTFLGSPPEVGRTPYDNVKEILEAVWNLCCERNFNFKNEIIVRGLVELQVVYLTLKDATGATRLFEYVEPHIKEEEVPSETWRKWQYMKSILLYRTRSDTVEERADHIKTYSYNTPRPSKDQPRFITYCTQAQSYFHHGDMVKAFKLLCLMEEISCTESERSELLEFGFRGAVLQELLANMHFNLAVCYNERQEFGPAMDQLSKAETILQQIIEDKPDTESLGKLGFVMSYRGLWMAEKAARMHELLSDEFYAEIDNILQVADHLAPDNFFVLYQRACVLRLRGDLATAAVMGKRCARLAAVQQVSVGRDLQSAWISFTDDNILRMFNFNETLQIDLSKDSWMALVWAERAKMRLFMQVMDQGGFSVRQFDEDDDAAQRVLTRTVSDCGPNSCVVEYSTQADCINIYVLFWREESLVCAHVKKMCPDLEDLVMQTRTAITDQDEAKEGLSQLHSILVEPVLRIPALSCDSIIFVPFGCLSLVPFAALYDKYAGKYLIERTAVSVVPCIRALSRCFDLQSKFNERSSPGKLNKPFLAGNPSPMGLGMEPLPGAETEVQNVAKLLGVQAYVGKDMSKENVLKGLRQSESVILLASHCCVNPSYPEGALVLQNRGRASRDIASSSLSEPQASEILTPAEVRSLKSHAGLVILSACRTAQGKMTSEGVLGLGRAFLQAGAATSVLTLWEVNDFATSQLVVGMFKELLKGEVVVKALRIAMLNMINLGGPVRDWASLEVFGSPVLRLVSLAPE